METSPEIIHDEKRQRFSLFVEGEENYLPYHKQPDGSWNFHFCFTPPSQRGRGQARSMVAHAKAYCEGNGISYSATCPYVSAIMGRLRTRS